MKKLWLIGILIVSLFFLACSGQFETTLSLAEDEEISGSFGSYNYYLQVTQIDKKNSFCYLDTYFSSSAAPELEQIVLDKETPVKLSGFTASLVGIRESFTGDKCLIKVSNKRETTKITGAAARAPPPKPKTTATPTQPAAPSAGALAQCRDKKDNDGDGLIDFPADKGCTSSNDNNEADAAVTPAQPSTAPRAGTAVAPVLQPTTGARAGAPTTVTPVIPPQPTAEAPRAGTATIIPTKPTAGRAGIPVTPAKPAAPAQPATSAPTSAAAPRAGTATQPVTVVPRTAIANATSSLPRTPALGVSNKTTISVPECADKIDNDDDGLIDWPKDTDCKDRKGTSEGVKQESLTTTLPQCSDGIDNDGDGLIDYDQELSGCETTEDNDETDVAVATDTSLLTEEVSPAEETVTAALPEALQCADGIDNDGDGLIDYAGGDPGCSGEADSSEEDYLPEEPSGGGETTTASSVPVPSEAPSVSETLPEELGEELPPEEIEQPAEKKVIEAPAAAKEEVSKAVPHFQELSQKRKVYTSSKGIVSDGLLEIKISKSSLGGKNPKDMALRIYKEGKWVKIKKKDIINVKEEGEQFIIKAKV